MCEGKCVKCNLGCWEGKEGKGGFCFGYANQCEGGSQKIIEASREMRWSEDKNTGKGCNKEEE